VRGKNLTAMPLLLVLAVSLVMVNVAKAPTITVKLDPATPVYEPMDTFTISVLIENSPPISGWEFKIRWDFSILEFPPVINEGTFLGGGIVPTSFNVFLGQAFGYVQVGSTLLDQPDLPPSGSGTLATITFKVLAGGISKIDLFDVKLIDFTNANIIYTPDVVQGANFGTHKPFVDFEWTPKAPDVGETVTFNASASWDPDGTAIVKYAWDFGDGTPIVEETDPITTHTFAAYDLEPYLIKLTVTDEGGDTWYKEQQLRIWRDIAIADLWNDESANLDKTSYVMRRDFDLSLILITLANKGSLDQTMDVYLTVTHDQTGKQGVIEPLWNTTVPYMLGAEKTSDWDLMALWIGPFYGAEVPAGYYTMTATVAAPGDQVEANNVLSIKIRLVEAELVSKRITNHAFSISIHGDTLELFGKIKNTQSLMEPPAGITGRVVFEIENPLGETIVLKTDTAHLMNEEMSAELMVSLGPLTSNDAGKYYALAYAQYAADGGLTLDEQEYYIDVSGAGLTLSEKQKTFSFRIKL